AKMDASDRCPVALVINKGDRLLASEDYGPMSAEQALSRFFDTRPEPPHRQLRDDLRAAVGPASFRTFLASAFGKSAVKVVPGDQGRAVEQDMPVKDTRLASFGLEDPVM